MWMQGVIFGALAYVAYSLFLSSEKEEKNLTDEILQPIDTKRFLTQIDYDTKSKLENVPGDTPWQKQNNLVSIRNSMKQKPDGYKYGETGQIYNQRGKYYDPVMRDV